MTPPVPALPTGYRWALVAAVVVGFQVALAAAFDVQATLNVDEPVSLSGQEAGLTGLGLTPQAQREVFLASASGYQAAVKGMGGWRIATSLLLSIAAGLVFFLGMRMRVSPAHRAALAVELGRAAIATAVLRTIDGAENLVVARAVSEETSRAIAKAGAAFPTEVDLMTAGVSFASGAWTLLMVSVFVALGTYFRSAGLRDALERAEP